MAAQALIYEQPCRAASPYLMMTHVLGVASIAGVLRPGRDGERGNDGVTAPLGALRVGGLYMRTCFSVFVSSGGWSWSGCRAHAPAWGQLQQNEVQRQGDAASSSRRHLDPSRRGAVPATVRIRFYADDDYRSSGGGGRWQGRVRLTLSSLNQLVEGTFGIRFEGESFRRWPRQGPGGALQPILADLEKLDPGPDVDWVVGLDPVPRAMSFTTSAAPACSAAFVLRGMTSTRAAD